MAKEDNGCDGKNELILEGDERTERKVETSFC